MTVITYGFVSSDLKPSTLAWVSSSPDECSKLHDGTIRRFHGGISQLAGGADCFCILVACSGAASGEIDRCDADPHCRGDPKWEAYFKGAGEWKLVCTQHLRDLKKRKDFLG